MESPNRILVIQLRQLGDVVLTAALLEDLREAFPLATLDVLTGPRPAALVQGNPFLSGLLVYDRDRPLGMAREIRARDYTWVIDPQSSPRTAPLALLSGASRRVGWAIRGPWRFAYSDRISRRVQEEYVVRQRQRFLERLGVPTRPRVPRIFLGGEERARGIELVRALMKGADAPSVGMVLSARVAGTRWPAERFAELAARLAADGLVPVVIRTVGDEELVAEVLARAPGAVRADVPDLRPFAAVLAALDVFVSGDTGPAHIAMGVGTPTVTLYGASRAVRWNPGLPTTVAVSSPRAHCEACREARSRAAPGHTCILEIGVEEVHASVRSLLHRLANVDRTG